MAEELVKLHHAVSPWRVDRERIVVLLGELLLLRILD